YLLHFIPAFTLGIALLLAHIYADPGDRLLYYEYVLTNNKWPGKEASAGLITLSLIFFFSRIVFGIQTFVYLIRGYLLVKKYNSRIANFYSNTEGRKLNWVNLFALSFIITVTASVIANILGRGLFLDKNILLAVPSVLFSSLFFIIGFLGNKQNFTIKSFHDDEKENTSELKRPAETRNRKLNRFSHYDCPDR
ncbi:MAG: hypothetical protein PHH93_13295, partial [Prolixibacteraceae bacterium]|nr:hypothetical protein [Prolixibacteraceae bacterium]